jgi:hypothetical protein
MAGESGGDGALPLLPVGTIVFAALPLDAVVLDALAPAIGNGMITLRNGADEGVLVIRDGVIDEAVWVADGLRITGADALARARDQATTVSAYRLADEAMVLVGPLIRAETCYSDLHLEWMVWPQLLNDLRQRGGTTVVELSAPTGRGITLIRNGEQVATFLESQPALGPASLLDDLAAAGTGTVRVLVDRGVNSPLASTDQPVSTPGALPPTSDIGDQRLAIPTVTHADDPNAMLSAIFGPHPDAVQWHPVAIERPARRMTTSVESVLPQITSLVHDRLQRSSGSVEEVVQVAAGDHQSVAWLADRVRVMTVRGFLRTTFEQLADDMLALAGSEAD